MNMETRKRSILKTLTFRAIATLITSVLVFTFTRNMIMAGVVGLLDLILKLIIYYFHERLWNRISWGQKLSN